MSLEAIRRAFFQLSCSTLHWCFIHCKKLFF